MILAVADYAEHDIGPKPPDLRIAEKTDRWGLPFAGGWMEQPAGMLDRAGVAMNVYRAMRSFREAGAWGAWAHANPDHYRIVSRVRMIRKSHGR